jgi:hypothetical protein
VSRTIWKFELHPARPDVQMPAGAKLLHVHEQNGKVCVWAEVDSGAPLVLRRFYYSMTGGMVIDAPYVGTAHITEGIEPVVVHVYDRGEGT